MRILLVACFILLSACGLIRDRSSEYVQSDPGSTITIPSNLSDRYIQSQYPIPEINNKRPLSDDFELPKPPNATAALDEAPYTIDQVNDQLWLRLYLAPGKVWPLLDAFWQNYDIAVIEENISKGFVVTSIIEDSKSLKGALAEADGAKFSLDNVYFQAKLTQGIRRNTSEIKLRVIDAVSSQPLRVWQKNTANIERDRAVLNVMGDFISSDALQNRYSLLANTIGGESRIQLLQREGGENYLQLNLTFQRAWNELEKALLASEVVIADKNLGEKTFYVSYLNVEEINQWYVSEEAISEKKLERNFSLKLIERDNGTIEVEVIQLNERFDPAIKNDLLDIVFEHIS